jgi:hypothetical protein
LLCGIPVHKEKVNFLQVGLLRGIPAQKRIIFCAFSRFLRGISAQKNLICGAAFMRKRLIFCAAISVKQN